MEFGIDKKELTPTLVPSHPANGVTRDICNVFLKLTVLIQIVSINIYLKYNKYKKS